MNYYVYSADGAFEFDTYDLGKAKETVAENGGRITDEYGNDIE